MDHQDSAPINHARRCLIQLIGHNGTDEAKLQLLTRAVHALKVGGRNTERAVEDVVVHTILQSLEIVVDRVATQGSVFLEQVGHSKGVLVMTLCFMVVGFLEAITDAPSDPFEAVHLHVAEVFMVETINRLGEKLTSLTVTVCEKPGISTAFCLLHAKANFNNTRDITFDV